MRCQLSDWNLISPHSPVRREPRGGKSQHPHTLPAGPMPGTRATNQTTPHSPKQSAGGVCWTNSHHHQHTPLSLPRGDTVQRQVPSTARQEVQPEPSRQGAPIPEHQEGGKRQEGGRTTATQRHPPHHAQEATEHAPHPGQQPAGEQSPTLVINVNYWGPDRIEFSRMDFWRKQTFSFIEMWSNNSCCTGISLSFFFFFLVFQ